MEAWRSSCPRFTVWEDALAAGLISVESDWRRPLEEADVRLSTRGREVLSGLI
jgi:hypothetical protein